MLGFFRFNDELNIVLLKRIWNLECDDKGDIDDVVWRIWIYIKIWEFDDGVFGLSIFFIWIFVVIIVIDWFWCWFEVVRIVNW